MGKIRRARVLLQGGAQPGTAGWRFKVMLFAGGWWPWRHTSRERQGTIYRFGALRCMVTLLHGRFAGEHQQRARLNALVRED